MELQPGYCRIGGAMWAAGAGLTVVDHLVLLQPRAKIQPFCLLIPHPLTISTIFSTMTNTMFSTNDKPPCFRYLDNTMLPRVHKNLKHKAK